jgi:hypothetical protein
MNYLTPRGPPRLYDVVRVVATVVGAGEGELVWFRAFDVDDPSASEDAVDDDREPHVEDNRGRLTALNGTPILSRRGLWLVAERGTVDRQGVPIPPGELRSGGEILGVPVVLREGKLVASLLFRVTHSPGDNFKIAAACGKHRIRGRSFDARDLLGRTENVDRPGDENDGLLLYLYQQILADRTPTAAMRVPRSFSLRTRLSEFTATGWFWRNDPLEPVKVSPTLAVWRNLYVELDQMRTPGRIERPAQVDRIRPVGDEGGLAVFEVRTFFRTRETFDAEFNQGFLRFDGAWPLLNESGDPGVPLLTFRISKSTTKGGRFDTATRPASFTFEVEVSEAIGHGIQGTPSERLLRPLGRPSSGERLPAARRHLRTGFSVRRRLEGITGVRGRSSFP